MLNDKQERFCVEYAKTANAAESYRRAYGDRKESTLYSNANRLLKNAKIQARLAELTAKMKSENIAQAGEIQERLTRILRREETEDTVVVEGVDKGVSEARIIQQRASLKDVISAGTTLARMQGAYENKVNVNITVPVIGGEEDLED